MTDTCATCRFNHETECRRFPPQVTLMDVPTTNSYGEATGHNFYGTQAWPIIEPAKDWCGEWKGQL